LRVNDDSRLTHTWTWKDPLITDCSQSIPRDSPCHWHNRRGVDHRKEAAPAGSDEYSVKTGFVIIFRYAEDFL
jgi:hypothetical protein